MKRMRNKTMKTRSDYFQTHAGLKLLANLDPEHRGVWQVGVWQVFGERDEDGSSPSLGYYRGMLSDVIDVAIRLPRFWTYGHGGEIRRVPINDIDSKEFKERERLKRVISDAQAQLEILELDANG